MVNVIIITIIYYTFFFYFHNYLPLLFLCLECSPLLSLLCQTVDLICKAHLRWLAPVLSAALVWSFLNPPPLTEGRSAGLPLYLLHVINISTAALGYRLCLL